MRAVVTVKVMSVVRCWKDPRSLYERNPFSVVQHLRLFEPSYAKLGATDDGQWTTDADMHNKQSATPLVFYSQTRGLK